MGDLVGGVVVGGSRYRGIDRTRRDVRPVRREVEQTCTSELNGLSTTQGSLVVLLVWSSLPSLCGKVLAYLQDTEVSPPGARLQWGGP